MSDTLPFRGMGRRPLSMTRLMFTEGHWVLWDPFFTGNISNSSGGAIYVLRSPKRFIVGDTYFHENEAAIDGGAAFVSASNDDATPSFLILKNDSGVLFLDNTCGGNGRATVFIGEVFPSFSLNMMFLDNTAGVASGVIYVLGATVGMRGEGEFNSVCGKTVATEDIKEILSIRIKIP